MSTHAPQLEGVHPEDGLHSVPADRASPDPAPLVKGRVLPLDALPVPPAPSPLLPVPFCAPLPLDG